VRNAASGTPGKKFAGVVPLPDAGAAETKRARMFRGQIDPLRVIVWSVFGALLLGAWAAIGWLIWRATG